ncbi:hypothetical protein Patl1_18245 [Pistacia atlantica]|uniref:Uncharacterized protein n=1 Tax=Pistacia atlantica TaxID=434234 RepID=A0ACC1C0D8_9ROSI|nr:hypothetical protein Patl1_18245 [Pistacia atlantica]
MEDTEKPASASENVKDLNAWLPVTKSRNAKWWYSAFHNVRAMVGAGVLGLPLLSLNSDVIRLTPYHITLSHHDMAHHLSHH